MDYTKQDIFDIITEWFQTNGSALGTFAVRELTEDELTDENLQILTIPGMVPDTEEWVQTSMANMIRPIVHAVSDITVLKQSTEAARDGANAAAAASTSATQGAERVNIALVGMTVTTTDRNGTTNSVNIGFEISEDHVYPSKAAMIADAGNVPKGAFCMIATSDKTAEDNATLWSRNALPADVAAPDLPFTFLSDLDQASSSAWADWLENMKPQIESAISQAATDHTRAEGDHTTASGDHTLASGDHSQAAADHLLAADDHTQAGQDHTRAGQDHATFGDDHTQAVQDHTRAAEDHTRAEGDHTTADADHTLADGDHATAEGDHTRAENDHTTADGDHTAAGQDHTRASDDHTLAGNDHTRAENMNAHPPYIADGTAAHPGDAGFFYSWDYTAQQYVRGAKLSLDWSSMTEAEKQALAEAVMAGVAFDDLPTQGSDKAVRSGGLYTALEGKQDTLEFATDEEAEASADELT